MTPEEREFLKITDDDKQLIKHFMRTKKDSGLQLYDCGGIEVENFDRLYDIYMKLQYGTAKRLSNKYDDFKRVISSCIHSYYLHKAKEEIQLKIKEYGLEDTVMFILETVTEEYLLDSTVNHFSRLIKSRFPVNGQHYNPNTFLFPYYLKAIDEIYPKYNIYGKLLRYIDNLKKTKKRQYKLW